MVYRKTAGPAVVQLTVIHTLHKEDKTEGAIVKETDSSVYSV